MARFYVKNDEGNWNIWSSSTEMYELTEFVPFEDLKEFIIQEVIEQKKKELDTLLTDSPELNTKSFEECEETIAYNEAFYNDEEENESTHLLR